MKIEMGESLMLSWLKHAKSCKITQLNWKPSGSWQVFNEDEVKECFKKINEQYPDILKKNTFSQFLSQAEIDVLGIDVEENKYYAVDVAFHELGLNYGGTKETVERITKKALRSALILYYQFNTKNGEIIFAAPKINNSIISILNERFKDINNYVNSLGFNFNFRLLANNDFNEKIMMPIIEISSNIADTSELFMRAFQLYELVNNNKHIDVLEVKRDVSKESDFSEFPVGEFVKNKLHYLFENNLIPEDEIEKLKDKQYSKKVFDLNFPLLINKDDNGLDTKGHDRYWKREMYANKYRVCSQWFKHQRHLFEQWYNGIIKIIN
ncbi:MAG: hypothetical protein PHR82_08320 [Endomicrobiaceae bacterium]|nr:hypothetical protein [Endomicrobiaceae bacterium]